MNKKCTSVILAALVLGGCGYGNVDEVKAVSEQTFAAQDFEVVGYHGYRIGMVIPFTNYGGGVVCYNIRTVPANGVIYTGCLQKWGDETHVVTIRAKDAYIKP